MRLHSLPPPSSIGSGIRIFVILLLALLGPGVASASEDVVTIIVRFTEGEVSFPEGAYENTAPLEEVVFETEQLKIALANSGVYALSLVCPGWRHLEAPQYDIDGNEIDVAQMVDFTDVYRLEWNGTVPPEQIGFRLRGFSQVVYVDLMPLMDLHYDPPNDPLFSGQWGLHNTGQVYSDPDSFECVADYDINALEAWDIKDTSTVRVGLIDLGIDRDHEDLEDALDPYLWYPPESMGQEDCDTWPHGSATAGIVGAVGGNNRGVAGVASPRGGGFLVPMRAAPTHPDSVCGVDGGLAANALAWAASSPVFPQIRIVSNSWGGPRLDFERGGFYRSVRDAFRNAYLKGLFLTASAGNDTDFPHYPAAFPDYSTSVGSILCDGTHPDDYIRGYYIDVVAPGGAVPDVPVDHIKTTWGDDSNDQYFGAGSRPHFGGTSASAPFVAGVAALLWSVPTLWNSLTNDDLDGVLKATARDLGGDGPDNTFGHGLVRADSALILISPPNKIMKNQVSPTRIDSIETLDPQEFMNIPCVISGREQLDTLTAQMYEMVGYAPFVEPALAVWTRGRQTNGWRPLTTPPVTEVSDGSYDGLAYWNWAEVDSATVTAEGCSLRAYTYKFFKDGDFLGWYPVDGSTGLTTCTPSPQPASLAYTYVVGGGDPLAGDTPRLQLRIRGANPSNQAYHLSWTSSEREEVEAAIFDAAGRRIRLLFSGVAGPGETRLTWDLRDTNGRRVPAGVYFLKVTAGGAAGSRKLLVVPKGGGPR